MPIIYKETNHFIFRETDNISQVCNAPNDKAGVYITYCLRKGKIELVYIGRSGKVTADGTLFVRKGGIKDRLVNGKRDGELRRNFWIREMKREKIEALDIYWYVTHCDDFIDCPKKIENELLIKYYKIYGERPRWNRR